MTDRAVPTEPTLLPCPFCGGEPRMVSGGPGCTFIQCSICNASGDDGSEEYAVEKWNCRAALTAALPVIERAKWQPIETAPKDGTSILLFASDYPPLSYMGVGQWAFADPDLGFVEGWFWPFAIRPTHWMPLPVPPALAGEER